MARTLAIVDRAGVPTGVHATVAGSGGTQSDIYAARFTGTPGPLVWALVASIVGDGTVDYDRPPGMDFAYAVRSPNGPGGPGLPIDVSPLAYYEVTDGLTAVATRVRNSVRDLIAALALPVANIYTQWGPGDETNVTFPCVILTVYNQQEAAGNIFSGFNDTDYPVHVMICDRQDERDPTHLGDYELWRQKIVRTFNNRQLPLRESVVCKVRYDPIVNPELPKFQYMVSELTVLATCREPSGLAV